MNYQNKRILITGGTGFIGSRLAERLVIEEKADVTILVNSWSKATWVSRLNVKLVQGTILEQEKLDQIMQDIDLVFHCVGVGGSLENCMKINVQGTKNVLEAALKNKVKRVVYFSTVVVTGPEILEGMNEERPFLETGNAYADSKIEAEKIFLNFVNSNSLEGSVIRPTFVWGPISPYYTIDIIQQMKTKTFQLIDEGKGACNAVYIDNLIDLALVCGLHPKANGEVFLIRDLEKYSWNNFYSYFARMLGMDVSAFQNIPSKANFGRKINLGLKHFLEKRKANLTHKVIKYQENKPFETKVFFKVPRKVVKFFLKPLAKRFPEMDAYETQSFASTGFLDISKSEKMLDFVPKIKLSQGMKDCEKSLKLQNYI